MMKEEVFSTSDLWQGALLLAETDAELIDVHVSYNGRETIIFSFSGEGLSHLAKAYCRNEAMANVTQLRSKLNDLRDLIFQQRQRR